MKKILALVLSCTMMFSFVGCGSTTSTDGDTAGTEPKQEESAPTEDKEEAPAEAPEENTEAPAEAATGGGFIGVSMPTQSLQRWNQDGANMKAALEAKGYTVQLEFAEDKVETQVLQIENMITQKCEVLVVASIDGEALTNVLQQAADAGIKVVAYDRLIRNTANVDYYATFDNFKVGVIQGTYIEEQLDLKNAAGPFNIEFFGGSSDDNNAYFFNGGAMSVLQPYLDSGKLVCKSGQTDMAQISILGWKSEDAQARMDNLIAANYTQDKLDAVLSPNDSLAYGIASSLESAGFGSADKPYPILTGQDCDIANVKNMLAGKQSMSVFKDTRALADKVVEMVDAILTGSEPPINDTSTYDNGVKVVPSYLLEPVFASKDNYKELLIDSGYYTEAELQ